MNKIIQVFFNVDMRNGVDGLMAIAEKAEIDLAKVSPGHFLVFINSRKNRLKLFASKDVYAYYRSTEGPINMLMIQHLPRAFNGSKINFSGALRAALLKEKIT